MRGPDRGTARREGGGKMWSHPRGGGGAGGHVGRASLEGGARRAAEVAAEALDLDGLLCNRFVVHDGRFTGELVNPLCYGAGKVDHAEQEVAASGMRLEDCAFYTDSMSDLPLLERVGRPVPVHPDPRLRREALRRGWEIADWGANPLRA